MGHQSYVLLCTETTLSNPPVVQPKSSCDVHLLRSPWINMGLLPTMIQYFVASFTNKQIEMLLQKKITPFWVALEPQMWSFHLSSLDLSLELVQPKDEKVFYSLRRPKLENLIIVSAGDLLMLRHANWLVLFPVHLAPDSLPLSLISSPLEVFYTNRYGRSKEILLYKVTKIQGNIEAH